MTALTNAQKDNLLQRVHEERYADEVFRDEVLADHPAFRQRLRAQRAATPPRLRSIDEDEVQQTVDSAPLSAV